MELDEKHHEILVELADCARAMGPYRADVVVTGGLAPLLYRYHAGFNKPRQKPLLTGDLDLTVPESIPLREDARLVDCLAQGGFVIVRSRSIAEDAPPKHFFQRKKFGAEDLAPIHGEFLSPLTGPKTDRNGKPKSPREVQAGLNAEALRFLDLLLWQPIEFDLGSIGDLQIGEPLVVQLPNPGAYLVQKALCSERRDSAEKRDKDLAYLFDVATLTHGQWTSVRRQVEELRKEGHVWSKWIDSAAKILDGAFGSSSAFGPPAVQRVYEGAVQANTVGRVMTRFLTEIGLLL